MLNLSDKTKEGGEHVGNRSKRRHWSVKRSTVDGLVVEHKRLVPGHGCIPRLDKKSAPQERGAVDEKLHHRLVKTRLK